MADNIYTVTLPDIGEGVVEGEVVSWLKQVGDPLKKDEPVVIVMTDKATVELPAPYAGTLAKQHYQLGQIAIKDLPLYDIALAEHISVPKFAVQTPKETSTAALPPSLAKNSAQASPIAQDTTSTVLAPPYVRHLARTMGIDLAHIRGTGKQGRITEEDLRTHCQKQPDQSTPSHLTSLAGDEIMPLIGIKAMMAEKMAESKARIPHFSYFEEVDVTRLVQLKNNVKREANSTGIHLTYMPFIIKALSLTIRKHPLLNSSYDLNTKCAILHTQHNIGIAMSTPLGLIVPVIKNVQELTLEQLIRNYDLLIQQAQQHKLPPSSMKDATITISNFGGIARGGLWATPIINYPEAAILAFARIHKAPIVKNETLVIRDVLNLSWSFDHRLIDGDMAAHISHSLSQMLHDPAVLL